MARTPPGAVIWPEAVAATVIVGPMPTRTSTPRIVIHRGHLPLNTLSNKKSNTRVRRHSILGSESRICFDDLPPDLERLRTLRVWHAMWLGRIDRKIELLLKRQAEQEHGRRAKPEPPEWVVELGIGVGRPPVQVHRGSCYMADKRRRPVEQDEARRLLADGTSPCTHCRPDTGLGIAVLPQGSAPNSVHRPGPSLKRV